MILKTLTRVLIVGAGPTGLTLACDLVRRGVRCRIIDKAAQPFQGSRAKGLMPRTLEVFDDLGVIPEILASGGLFPLFRGYAGGNVIWERTIHEMGQFPILKPAPALPYPDFWMIPQWRTDEILRSRLGALGVAVEQSTELTDFTQDPDGVTALLHGPGGAEWVRVDYLAGADGGRSTVRKTLGVDFIGDTDESDRSILADVRAEGLDRGHWHMWTNPAIPAERVSLCPLPGTDRFQFVAPLTGDGTPQRDLSTLQAIFDERSGRSGIRLSDLSWMTVYRVNVRMAERFRTGRVFLAGDAAHVHFPAAGQGLNTGVQDAYNLGWKLGAVLAGAPDGLLDSYEAERLPVAAHVLGFTSKLRQQGFPSQTDPAKQAEDLGQNDVYQLKLNYRSSALSRDDRERPGAVRAGDRAPDGACYDAGGTIVRLFDLFRGAHFTLLAFGRGTTATVATINAKHPELVHAWTIVAGGNPSAQGVLVDTFGQIFRDYDIDIPTNTLVLMRPDGYVGLVTNDLSAGKICDYLKNVSCRSSECSALA